MKRICYSDFHTGPRLFGEKPPFGDPTETHGICDNCLPLELARIRNDISFLKMRLTDPAPAKNP